MLTSVRQCSEREVRHRVCLVGVSSSSTVDASFESHITIVLYDVLERQLVKRGHLLEDEGVITVPIRVEGPVE
jgi:hypothetical protein